MAPPVTHPGGGQPAGLGCREGSSYGVPPHLVTPGSLRSPPVPQQPNECIKTLADMKVTLKELCTELREERRGASELQQQFTKAKAAWEMERAELKCHIAQVGAMGTLRAGGDVGLAGGLLAPRAQCWQLGRAARQDGTVGISMSSCSGRRVSIATGLA